MKTYVVDTHTMVWFISRDRRLSDKAGDILRDPDTRLIIPVLVTSYNFSSSATQPRASSSSLARVGRPFSSQPAIW
jgi:PIN domain nuclease of toxin-antitoxin system